MNLLPCVVAALALAAGCGANPPEEAETDAAVPVSVAPAISGPIHAVLHATGIVTPAPGAELIVIAPEAGRIAAIPSAEGEAVARGDLLVRFEIPSLAAEVTRQTAEINRARAAIVNARANADRQQDLYARGIAAHKEVEDAVRAVSDAEAALALAQAARASAVAAAARTTVRAPFAGIVVRRSHNPGDLVEPTAADPVLRLVDPSRLEVVASLPAGGAADVAVGGRELGLRLLDAGTDQGYSVLFIEDTTRAREQAQQLKLAALGRLTANIAHEIRNPLAAISHAAELLPEEKRAEDRARLARIIHDNTQRLERLVSDVLQLNRRDRVNAEPLRVKAWLRDFLPEIAAVEGADADAFALDVQGDPWVEFDHEHLRQVLWNLLRNAMRYADPGVGAVRVLVRGYGDRVELSVVDNGPGVPASSRGHLFEPFFTTEAKGTGLGLYLARELCAANRASLEYVADMPGAHFRILCREARRQ
jgi:RND family efflux transporter MFP subunit